MTQSKLIVLVPLILLLIAPIAWAQGNTLGDMLRPIATMAENVDILTKFAVVLFSVAMFVVALLAYRKTQTNKMMLIALAFGLFALKSAVKIVDLYLSPGLFFGDASENVVELVVLGLLFLAIFKR